MKALTSIKAQAGKIKENIIEIYTMLLIVIGVPAVVYALWGWRIALLAALLDHVLIGLLYIKYGAKN